MLHSQRSLRTLLLLVSVLGLASAGAALAGKPGDAGFLSLRWGVGARETAMGGAGVASARGAAAIYWNPANLAFQGFRTELLLQHQGWLGLFNKETAAIAHRTSLGVIGFFFSGFYADEIERYSTEPVGVPEGTFEPYDVVVGLAYSRKIAESFAAGLMIKMLYEKIDVYSDSGFAFDLFISHRAVIEGLSFGASVTNLGGQFQLRDEPFDLPLALRIGAAYDPPQSFFAGKVTLAGDVIAPNDGNEKAHIGAEYRLVPLLSLRLGTKINYDSQGLTAGAGLRKDLLEIGYAFEDMNNDLDPMHKFVLELHY
jgi:hypothetical protein